MQLSNKKILLAGVILLLGLVFLAGCTNEEKEMGVIDMTKVIRESPKAQEYQNQLDQIGVQIQEEYRAIDENESLSETEKEAKQQELLQKFVAAKEEIENKLNADIEKAVEEVVVEKKLSIIFFKQSVRHGGVDITNEVINKLK